MYIIHILKNTEHENIYYISYLYLLQTIIIVCFRVSGKTVTLQLDLLNSFIQRNNE